MMRSMPSAFWQLKVDLFFFFSQLPSHIWLQFSFWIVNNKMSFSWCILLMFLSTLLNLARFSQYRKKLITVWRDRFPNCLFCLKLFAELVLTLQDVFSQVFYKIRIFQKYILRKSKYVDTLKIYSTPVLWNVFP